PLSWTTEALLTEKDLENERRYTQVHFRYEDGEHDYFSIQRTQEEKMEKPVEWFSVRAPFFNSTIIADKAFTTGDFKADIPEKDTTVVAHNVSDFRIPITASDDFSFGFRWLISPNDYNLLKSYNLDLDEMIQLGYGPFFFVKYISKWIIIPLFNFLSTFVS